MCKRKIFQLFATLVVALTFAVSNATAQETISKVDTDIFPKAEKGYKKMVIEVPYSDRDASKRIEFSVGKYMEVDGCNHYGLQGETEVKDLQGWGYQYYIFKTNGDVISTQMGCPDLPKRNLFVSAAPTNLRYNGKMPIVIYVPEEYSVQFKIFTTTDEIYQAAEAPSKSK
ncbi:ecotin family protein [Sphingobacterium sp. UBA6645]|uniref:ecotin family protein n=1 Tax=Sphingobacterium sp. UBA6645 TaxID=1947511 RepID=UPI0025FFC164|nr:ecotin family protein [Sphingobacterium sp. UBA6645]